MICDKCEGVHCRVLYKKVDDWIEAHEQIIMVVFWLVWLIIGLLIVDY